MNRVGKLLAMGANIESNDDRGMTPFLSVIRAGSVAAVSMLLASGLVDEKASCPTKKTTLIWATYQGKSKLVKLLVRERFRGFEGGGNRQQTP